MCFVASIPASPDQHPALACYTTCLAAERRQQMRLAIELAVTRRVRLALAAVGPGLAGVLIDVCCHSKGLEVTEKSSGWPQRSGKIILQIALCHLARHYGFETSGSAHTSRARASHWGTPDYRPKISNDYEGDANSATG